MSTTSNGSALVEAARFYSTEHGDELMRNEPDMKGLFLDAAADECLSQRHGRINYPFIGGGEMSRVVALDGNLCLKTSGPWSGRRSHDAGKPTRKPSLVHEMHYMNAVGQKLRSKDELIQTPTYFMACRFPRQIGYATTCLLQSQLPETATSFLDLARKDRERFKYIANTIRERVGNALGFSALRFGAWDLHGDRKINPGNVLLGPDLDPEAEIYLFDLVGPHPVSTNTARVVSLLRRARCV